VKKHFVNSLATQAPPSARRTDIFTLVGVAASVGGVLTAMALALSPTAAQAASGLEPGVHVDPGSPAAKEYAIPLAQARQIGRTGSSSDGSSAALFGAGIGPRGPGGSSRSSSTARSGPAAAKPPGHRPASGPNRTPRGTDQESLPSSLLASSSRASGSGDSSILALVGGGVLILILGGFGGTVLRRTRHPGTSG
jgi:hypothetical protein